MTSSLIVHVVHGSLDISDLFGHLVVSPFEQPSR